MTGYKFQIRQVEAWYNEEEGWWYNNVWNIGEMVTCAKDIKLAITNWLKAHQGIVFKRGRTRIEFDGDNYTIVDRKTGEPLFDAMIIPW